MSKLTVTNFSKRTGSPFQKNDQDNVETKTVVHEEVLQSTSIEKHKKRNEELTQKVNRKSAEYQSNKPNDGVFTEVVSHGAFTSKKIDKDKPKEASPPPYRSINSNGSKIFLGFPSSANDLALDAKTDLESDPNISNEVKEKVIEKLFALVSMVQHTYESKVRIMTEFEKFKETHMKNEMRREKEHSEQLYKLNINYQSEVIQAIQQLRCELDLSRNNTEDATNLTSLKENIITFSAPTERSIDTVDKK